MGYAQWEKEIVEAIRKKNFSPVEDTPCKFQYIIDAFNTLTDAEISNGWPTLPMGEVKRLPEYLKNGDRDKYVFVLGKSHSTRLPKNSINWYGAYTDAKNGRYDDT